MSVEARFDLQQAIVANQLALHYQPIIDVRTRRLVAVEALVRWKHPARGLLQPSQFVPAIERAGLAREFTLWVLREAIMQSTVWKHDGTPISVGVNLSPENLRDALFRRFLEITLRAVGSPELLIAELPGATLTAPEQIESLTLMRSKGIRVAIDDVIAPVHTEDIPADFVKIGRALVQRLPADSSAIEDATAIVREAKSLGRGVMAVGIEDDLTWRRVVALGCDSAQGFHIAQPMSTAELAMWRQRHS